MGHHFVQWTKTNAGRSYRDRGIKLFYGMVYYIRISHNYPVISFYHRVQCCLLGESWDVDVRRLYLCSSQLEWKSEAKQQALVFSVLAMLSRGDWFKKKFQLALYIGNCQVRRCCRWVSSQMAMLHISHPQDYLPLMVFRWLPGQGRIDVHGWALNSWLDLFRG